MGACEAFGGPQAKQQPPKDKQHKKTNTKHPDNKPWIEILFKCLKLRGRKCLEKGPKRNHIRMDILQVYLFK